MVIAIMTDHDEAALRRAAALRQPEGTGLMVLLDTSSFAVDGVGRPGPEEPTERARALAAMVTASGWSTCVVGSGMTVATAWDVLSAHSSAMVGSGS
jgi:hypothetical protein